MARHNPTAPVVAIELDRPRTLRLDFNALVDFEEATGKSAFDQGSFANLRGSDLRALLWAALRHEDEGLTLQQVGAMLHFGNIEYVSECVGRMMGEAMPTAEGEGASDDAGPLTG